MTEYGAHVFNTFDSDAMHWGWCSDRGYGNEVDVSQRDYINSKNELAAYIQSLEDKQVPTGFKLVPIEPTEEMIRAACMNQSSVKFDTYKEWAESLSNGVVEMIRRFEVSTYKSMVGAYSTSE